MELVLIAESCGVTVADLRADPRLRREVRCAGRTDDEAVRELTVHLLHAFGAAETLDALGIPEEM